ncbi:MAG: chromosomal replication initiator protein DnaA [Clostridia bacterium]|nr:chromosomal replication initiator protein DnaA [Clostridia bacterium]
MDNHEALWSEVCERIKNSGLIPQVLFDTWIKPIYKVKFGERILYLWTPNTLVKNSISERYVSLISDAANRVTKNVYKLCVLLPEETAPSEDELLKDEISYFKEETKINENYTFENFIVGQSNRFAHAYALSAAESPGSKYLNPLFLCAGAGLGKTHLCHAIVNFSRMYAPERKVIYVSAEKYTNEFITSLKEKRTHVFREKYRNADILIVDDIQFISGKYSTIEEFFHTFNDLYDNGKQIVLTSDRPPSEINDIEERLISRFNMGLNIEINPPDFETRLAILQQKAEKENLFVDEKIFTFIADNVFSNIRDLEGALNKIHAFARINKELEINEKRAGEILKNYLTPAKELNITYKMVEKAVADYFHITLDNLLGKSKRKEFVNPRQICMYICSEKVADATSVTIGQEFGRDHSTVLYAINKISDDIEKNSPLKSMVEDIVNVLENQ